VLENDGCDGSRISDNGEPIEQKETIALQMKKPLGYQELLFVE
jgi:hypothetical protein